MARNAVESKAGKPEILPERTCPFCGSLKVHRSRRHVLEKWFSWTRSGQRKYKCRECKHRFWNLKDPVPSRIFAHRPPENETSSSKKRHRRSDGTSPYQRFQVWLYRKHSLTVGILVLLMMAASLVIFFVILGIQQIG